MFKNKGKSVRQIEYASIIGNLGYVTDYTRHDLAYDIGLLCMFTSRQSKEHCQAIQRVMWYLKKTVNLDLHYHRFPVVLEGYSDVDWNTLSYDFKATSGYAFNIVRGVVS